MIHELNIEQHHLDRIATGQKRAEIRKHDRDYQVGDEVHLYGGERYTYNQGKTWYFKRARHLLERDERGRLINRLVDDDPIAAIITHVLPADHFPDGIRDGYCVLSIEVAG